MSEKVENGTTVATWRAGVRVGPQRTEFTYDNLYQLRSATSEYRPQADHGYKNSSTFQYDEIGNLTKKAQSEIRTFYENQNPPAGLAALPGYRLEGNVGDYSYTLEYRYQGSRPHAPNVIVQTPANSSSSNHTIVYDASGNKTSDAYQGSTRQLVWDEESRLKSVTDNGPKGTFLYGPDGERTHKLSAGGESFYVNQFYTVQPSGILPVKHIFAGETRVASKTEPIAQYPTTSFYHPDHLGSLSYTSDDNQDLLQHERSFPFGERDLGLQEECDQGRPYNMRREWLFTGKELDWDTGLMYFGARYYDPKTAQWLSPDPILAEYMAGGGSGQLGRPATLSLFSYTWNNPIVLVDPDGRFPREATKLAIEYLHSEGIANPSTDQVYGLLFEAFPEDPELQRWASYSTADKIAAGVTDAVGSVVVPGYGDVMDASVLADPKASSADKAMAASSLAAGAGALPNYAGVVLGIKKIQKAIRYVDEVSTLALRGKAFTPGAKALRKAGLDKPRVTPTGRREFVDPKTGKVRAAWDKKNAKGGSHWHKFGPDGKTPLNDAGHVVEKRETRAHIPSR